MTPIEVQHRESGSFGRIVAFVVVNDKVCAVVVWQSGAIGILNLALLKEVAS